MKKLALIVATVACFALSSNAQKMFVNGTQLFKVGIGINGHGMPVDVAYERGVMSDFLGVEKLVLGLGAKVGYYGYKEDFATMLGSYSYKYSNIIIGANALAHYPLVEKLDTYAGFLLGYNVAKSTYSGPGAGSANSPSVGGFVFGGVVGARYEFSDSVGAYAEGGFGISNLTLGLAFKF